MSQFDKLIQAMEDMESGLFYKRAIVTVFQQHKKRIFTDGLDAETARIGLYSLPYLKQRIKKGYANDRKVILEFTGQMRKDYQVRFNKGKVEGFGFRNRANFDKSFWVEDTYDKDVFQLTDDEDKLLNKLLNRQFIRATT